MINATPFTPASNFSSNATPNRSDVTSPPPAAPTPKEPMMAKPVVKKKMNWRIILGGLLLLFLIVGAATGFYLSQQSQEIRQKAYVGTGGDDSTQVCVECCVNGTTQRACRTTTALARTACGGVVGPCGANTQPTANVVCTANEEKCDANNNNAKIKCLPDGTGWTFTGQSCNVPPQTPTCPSGYSPTTLSCPTTQILQTTNGTSGVCYKCTNKANCYDLNNGCKLQNSINSTTCNGTQYFNTQADCLTKLASQYNPVHIAAGVTCTADNACICENGPDAGDTITNGQKCAVKFCYLTTDGCTALIAAANKISCNGTTEFDTKTRCQEQPGSQPSCASSLNRPDNCTCTTNPQCSSQFCQIVNTSSPIVGICKSSTPTCASTTNRPVGCDCATSPQCASGICENSKCTAPSSACIQTLGSKVAYDNSTASCKSGGGFWDDDTCSCQASCSGMSGEWKITCGTQYTPFSGTSSKLGDYNNNGMTCCIPTGTKVGPCCLKTGGYASLCYESQRQFTPSSSNDCGGACTTNNETKCVNNNTLKCVNQKWTFQSIGCSNPGSTGGGACNSGLPIGTINMSCSGNYTCTITSGLGALEGYGFKCSTTEWRNNRCLANEFWSGAGSGGQTINFQSMMNDPNKCYYQFDFNYPGSAHFQGNPAAVTFCYCPTNPTPPTPPDNPPPLTPVFSCDSGCSNDDECKTADSRFVCHSTLKRCRLAANLEASNCQPNQPAPMCLSITLKNVSNPSAAATADPKMGENVTFTCGAVTGATKYIFRVAEPDGTIVNLAATGRTSAQYTIAKTGKFYAQCQICTGQDNSTCHAYEAYGN